MSRIPGIAIAAILLVAAACAQKAPAEAELTSLLREFLHAAEVGDRAVFDRFFADDAIYTRSAGVTITKPDIMKNVEPPRPGEPRDKYGAEDIAVHQHGDTAIVAFRLTQDTTENGKAVTHHYRNTGTFMRLPCAGEPTTKCWRVIAWQATRIPEEQPKQ
jgi:hypothetical protein